MFHYVAACSLYKHTHNTNIIRPSRAQPHTGKHTEYVRAQTHTHTHTLSSLNKQTEQGHCGHLCEQQCWMFGLETALDATSNNATATQRLSSVFDEFCGYFCSRVQTVVRRAVFIGRGRAGALLFTRRAKQSDVRSFKEELKQDTESQRKTGSETDSDTLRTSDCVYIKNTPCPVFFQHLSVMLSGNNTFHLHL